MIDVDVVGACAPKSDQLNADDLIGITKTIEISNVLAGSDEQKIIIRFVGDNGKPYKPCKSMIRALISLYGVKSSLWIGKSITLFNDPSVRWGKLEVGGIRISHASDIQKPLNIALTMRKGVKELYSIKPLALATQQEKKLKRLELDSPEFEKCKAALESGNFVLDDLRKKYEISSEVEFKLLLSENEQEIIEEDIA